MASSLEISNHHQLKSRLLRICVPVLALMLYALSSGPVTSTWPRSLGTTFYEPLLWGAQLFDFTKDALVWYLQLWGVHLDF